MYNKGITLIESIIVITIMTIATLIIATTFISLWRLSQIYLSSFETGSQGSVALQKISEFIEEASGAVSSRVVNGASYITDEDTLVLKLPSIDAAHQIIAGNFDYAAISLSPAPNLIVDFESAASSVRPRGQFILSNLAQSLNFRYNSSTTTDITAVEVFLQTAKSSYDSSNISTLSTIAKLKNR